MPTCSDLAWHELWTEFNRHQTATFRVRKSVLAEVLQCHGETPPDDLIATPPQKGSETVEVNRHALYQFLLKHGALRCDAK